MKDIKTVIWTIIGFLILVGLELIYLGYWVGIVVGSLGLIAIAAGWKPIPANPSTIGAITVWGKLYKIGDKPSKPDDPDTRETIYVEGKTVLAPYFPFYIDVIEIDMTRKDWVFDITVMSVENADKDGSRRSVPVSGRVILTVSPHKQHINSYIQSGGDLSKIKDLMQGIIYRETQNIVRTTPLGDGHEGLNMIEITQSGNLIQTGLEKRLNGTDETHGIFGEKSFGVLCNKVQVEFKIPEEVSKSMMSAAKISFEISARNQEYDGDVAAANKFLDLAKQDGALAWNMAQQSRLIRDGEVQRIQIEGLGVPVGGHIAGELLEGKLRNQGNQSKKGKNS